MVPGGDVVATAIAVVLKADDGHEVMLRQGWVDHDDLVINGHHAALAKNP